MTQTPNVRLLFCRAGSVGQPWTCRGVVEGDLRRYLLKEVGIRVDHELIKALEDGQAIYHPLHSWGENFDEWCLVHQTVSLLD